MKHLVFRSTEASPLVVPADGYRFEFWKPSCSQIRPPHVPRATYTAWWGFHNLRVFANRGYSVLLGWHGKTLAHRIGIFPPYFRFPFMAPHDIQIGDVWTHPAHRRKGLAVAGITAVMEHARAPGRTFWYLVDESNVASIKAAERAGLSVAGTAVRTARFGLRLLGSFELVNARKL